MAHAGEFVIYQLPSRATGLRKVLVPTYPYTAILFGYLKLEHLTCICAPEVRCEPYDLGVTLSHRLLRLRLWLLCTCTISRERSLPVESCFLAVERRRGGNRALVLPRRLLDSAPVDNASFHAGGLLRILDPDLLEQCVHFAIRSTTKVLLLAHVCWPCVNFPCLLIRFQSLYIL